MLTLVIVAVVLMIGSFGYMAVEHWSFLDSFYVTFTNITTVGFTEVKPLSVNGKLFTMFVILMGILTIAYATSNFINGLIYLSKNNIWVRRMTIKNIASMNKHFVVCGYGKIGRMIARHLAKRFDNKVVVIDVSDERIYKAEADGFHSVLGSVKDRAALDKAGICRAAYVFVALSNDDSNMIATALIRKMNPGARIVVKVSEDSDNLISESLVHLGADYVIDPYEAGAFRMAEIVRDYF